MVVAAGVGGALAAEAWAWADNGAALSHGASCGRVYGGRDMGTVKRQAQRCRVCASVASGPHQPELRAGDGRRDRDHRNATPLSGIHFTPPLQTSHAHLASGTCEIRDILL
jgi:hypothetical protein